MQAGESLSFISMPDLFREPETIDALERDGAAYVFYTQIRGLLQLKDGSVQVFERVESDGIVTAKENSRRVMFDDGSYLHVVAYGHEYMEQYIDLGLSIAEHNRLGEYQKGFVYELLGSELSYSPHNPADSEAYATQIDIDPIYHFSLIDLYKHSQELYGIAYSDNEELSEFAKQQLAEWVKIEEEGREESNAGFNQAYPSLEDILTIKELMSLSVPFIPEK